MNDKHKGKLSISFSKCLFLISVLLMPSMAYAYVDPGSGSVIVTTILGLIAAIGYTVRKYFYKIKRVFFKTNQEDDSDSDGKR